MLVATRYTLKCDKCAVRLNDLKCRGDVPIDELLADTQGLLACVDYIYDFSLVGGETLLHPDLDQFIRSCAESEKLGNITVGTNGTVVPGEELLAALKEAKVTVKISKYPPALQPRVEEIKALFDRYQIPCIHDIGDNWVELGSFGRKKSGSPTKRFRKRGISRCTKQGLY